MSLRLLPIIPVSAGHGLFVRLIDGGGNILESGSTDCRLP